MTASVPAATSFFYTGDGSTTGFSFPLRFLENADVQVYVDDALKTLTTHYSLTGAGGPSGGTVTFGTAPAADTIIELRRATLAKQTIDLSDSGRTPGDTLEGQLDRLAMAGQDTVGRLDSLTEEVEDLGEFGVPAADLLLLIEAHASEVRGNLSTAPHIASRSALKALDTTQDTVAYLTEAGRTGTFVWSAGDYSALVTADAQEGVYVEADDIASSAGAWVRVFDGATDPRWFGAIGDNSSDNATAFASWIAVSSGRLVLPPGRFRTSGAISINLDTTPAFALLGAGESLTELTYTGTGDFITVKRATSVASLVGVIIDGITFTATRAGTANALVLELDDAAPSVGSYETLARRVSNCRFLPEGTGDYWGECIRWNNTTFGTTENITVRSDATTSGICVVYGGTRSAVDNTIHNLKGVSVDTLVLVENQVQEGLYINQLVGVSILRGVDWQVSGTSAPALVVDGGHLNIKDGGFAFIIDRVNAPVFSNLTVYLGGAAPTGFSIDGDLTYSLNPAFSNVNVYALGGSSNTTGLIIGADVNRAEIGGISFNDLTTGIVLTAGMKDVTVLPSVGFFNCTTRISHSGNISSAAKANRIWEAEADRQRLSFSNDTGAIFSIENLSNSVALKYVMFGGQGRDTVNARKSVGGVQLKQQDANWVNSDFVLRLRKADAEWDALIVKATGEMLLSTVSALATAAAGAIEYDGKAFYASAVASSRQVINAEQISILAADRTGSDVNTAQAVFGSGEDVITLAASTTYEFEALYYITRAAGTTSHTAGVLFAVGGSLTSIDYLAQVTNPTGNALAAVQQIIGSAATLVTLTAANTSATENLQIWLRGTIRTNAAGTITPQFQFSAAPGGAPTIKRNSFFRCWPIGTDTVAKVGNWA